MLQSIFVFQESLAEARGQAPGSSGGQDAEQGAASWDPAERLLEDLGAQATADKIANRKGGESAILAKVGPEHRPRERETAVGKRLLKPGRSQVDDRDRVADQRQGRSHARERLRLVGEGQVAGLPTRGGAELR